MKGLRVTVSASTQNAYSFLRQASNIAPVFLSLGNHETLLHTEDYEFFKKYGICLLDNEETELAVRDNFLTVGGLSTEADRAWLSSFARREGFRLLLCQCSLLLCYLLQLLLHFCGLLSGSRCLLPGRFRLLP